MKVFKNIENYEIPDGFHLTDEEEERLAADLKQIVTELIPLRDSKLKTRKYFNSHLRFNSNAREAQVEAGLEPDFVEFGEGYNKLPEEYGWNSDLLQPVLLNVLESDKCSFGYVINLIKADMEHRDLKRFYRGEKISDALVKFSLTFDIDEIRAGAKNIADLKERILYLNRIHTDCVIFEGLNQNEWEWVGEPVCNALDALIKEAEKEMEIEEKSGKKTVSILPGPNPTQYHYTSKKDKTRMKGDVLYDFSLLSHPHFGHLRMEVHGGCLTDPDANEFAFSTTVREMFARSFDTENKFQRNDLYYEDYPRFVYALMERYAGHVTQKYANDPRTGIRLMFEWLLKTREIIETNYLAYSKLYLASDIAAKKDLSKCQSKGTWPVKFNVYSFLYRYFHYRIETILPEMPDSLSDVIPFNMWDGQFAKLKEDYSGRLGLEFLKRAVVNVCDNRKRFFDVLVEQCITYCNQMSAQNPIMPYDDLFKHCDELMSAHLHNYFSDYIERLQEQSDNAADIDAAVLNWLVSMLTEVFDVYASNQGKVLQKCGRTEVVDIAAMQFYLDICERNVIEIAHEYFIDTERIPLVKPKPVDEIEPVQEETATEPAPVEEESGEEEPESLYDKTIDFDGMFNVWKDSAFTGITLDQFIYAIETPDFSVMMEKAEGARNNSGFVGSVKYIIKRLSEALGQRWYEAACKSIGLTTKQVDKTNFDTTRIHNMNKKVFSDCIN